MYSRGYIAAVTGIVAILAFGGALLFFRLEISAPLTNSTLSSENEAIQELFHDDQTAISNNITNTDELSTITTTSSKPSTQIPFDDDSTTTETKPKTSLSISMGFQGRTIPECCSSFCEIEAINTEVVHNLLRKVVQTPFFSHFSIDLCSSCELWEDAPLCSMKDCGVCNCEEPPVWSVTTNHLPPTGPDCSGVADDAVVTTVDPKVVDGWLSFDPNNNNPPFSSEPQAQVVDLLKNPEGYTGYKGPSAEKVWTAVHSENCFKLPASSDGQSCSLSPEQRLYNRFLSGIHSSISLHIAHSYCLEMDPHVVGECRLWGLNDEIAYDRVLFHQDRVENLFVAYSLLLKAVLKAGEAIGTAVPPEDPLLEDSVVLWKESLLPKLLELPQTAPETFDESSLMELINETNDSTYKSKRFDLQQRFEHLQSIMQCVGCDRCKLWGTLQTLGVGTALKVLFHDENGNTKIELSRQEAVALVNTLERLSSSLIFAQEFKSRREDLHLFESESSSPCFY